MKTKALASLIAVLLFICLLCYFFAKRVGRSLATQTNGTQCIFEATYDETTNAIVHTFTDWRYRGMELLQAADYPTSIPGWRSTNGFLLFPMDGPIATIPLNAGGNSLVPYTAYFHIIPERLDENRTKVIVRTIKASIIAGREPSIHGGWAKHNRNFPAVPQEETNVLFAIEARLRAGSTSER